MAGRHAEEMCSAHGPRAPAREAAVTGLRRGRPGVAQPPLVAGSCVMGQCIRAARATIPPAVFTSLGEAPRGGTGTLSPVPPFDQPPLRVAAAPSDHVHVHHLADPDGAGGVERPSFGDRPAAADVLRASWIVANAPMSMSCSRTSA